MYFSSTWQQCFVNHFTLFFLVSKTKRLRRAERIRKIDYGVLACVRWKRALPVLLTRFPGGKPCVRISLIDWLIQIVMLTLFVRVKFICRLYYYRW